MRDRRLYINLSKSNFQQISEPCCEDPKEIIPGCRQLSNISLHVLIFNSKKFGTNSIFYTKFLYTTIVDSCIFEHMLLCCYVQQ